MYLVIGLANEHEQIDKWGGAQHRGDSTADRGQRGDRGGGLAVHASTLLVSLAPPLSQTGFVPDSTLVVGSPPPPPP